MTNLNKLNDVAREHAGYLILLAIMLAGSAFLLWSDLIVGANIAEAKEAARPAEVELTLLTVPDCADCFSLSSVVQTIKKGPIDVKDERKVAYDSEEGKALVLKYGVSTVPNVIIRGETEKANAAEFLKELTYRKDDAAVWSIIRPVFKNTETGEWFGRVKLTMIDDATCEECSDPLLLEGAVRNNFGVSVSESTAVDRYSKEGMRLVRKYGVKALPTMILSQDVSAYMKLTMAWPGVGSIEDDGSFVLRELGKIGFAYRDLETGKVIIPATSK